MASSQNEEGRRVAKRAGLGSLATFCSRILGLVREQVIAYYFGAGNATDAFLVAFRIPNLLRDLFAEGAMSAAFVPTLSKTLEEDGKEAAWRLANRVLHLLIFVTVLLCAVGILVSPELVNLFAGEYRSVPGKYELTVSLTRMMFPFLPLVAVAALVMGVLNVCGHFFIPALSPTLFNVASILSCVVLVPVFRGTETPVIFSLAIGVLLGGLGQILSQVPLLFKKGYRWSPTWSLKDEKVKAILVLMVPGLIGLAATQANIFVNTILATGEGRGAVSWLQYAFRLVQFPIGVFGVAIATATLPSVSRSIQRFGVRAEESKSLISDSLKLVFLINIPASIGLIALSKPLIHLIFERGAFLPTDSIATAHALVAYSIGLFAYSGVKVLVPCFYALGNTRVPVVSSVLSVLLNMGLCLILVKHLSHVGLALGTSLMMILNFGFLTWSLNRKIEGFVDRGLVVLFFKVLFASFVMGGVAWWSEKALSEIWSPAISPLFSVFVAVLAYLLLVWVLRVEEARLLWDLFRRIQSKFKKG